MPSDDLFGDLEDDQSKNAKPDASVQPSLFREWRSPRIGTRNPDRMDNPIWAWLVRSRPNAYSANKQMNGPSSIKAGPCWCFDRFGQSSTTLPDGRRVFIGGEHEDYYDPDFYIYNDVVVIDPNGRIEIFGYPREVFPATDFHSATLVRDRVVIIGCLGYPDQRRAGFTPVFELDLSTFQISPVPTGGENPGWIYKHTSELSTDGTAIRIRGGTVIQAGDAPERENIDEWELSTESWVWRRVTDNKWPQFEFARKDGEQSQLFQIGMARFEKDFGVGREFENRMQELKKQLGTEPDFALFESLYRPPVQHEILEDKEDEYNVHRIRVAGVVVRYTEELNSIRLMIEGGLPESTVQALVQDLKDKLSKLENSEYAVTPI